MSELRYSDDAMRVLADFNNVDAELMRSVWPTASNVYMHRWLEALGHRLAAGEPIYREPRRLLTPKEIGLC